MQNNDHKTKREVMNFQIILKRNEMFFKMATKSEKSIYQNMDCIRIHKVLSAWADLVSN